MWMSGIYKRVMKRLWLILMISATAQAAAPVISGTPSETETTNPYSWDVSVTDGDGDDVMLLFDWNDSLVGWWRGENNGTDSSSSGNNATLAGSTTYASGRFGTAFEMTGAGDGLNIGDVSELDFRLDDDFTVSLWVYPHDDSNEEVIVGKGNGYKLFYSDTNTRWQCNMGSEETLRYVADVQASVQDQWWHLAFTYDGSSTTLILYVNGSSADTSSSSAGWIWVKDAFVVGDSWDGLIDEIAVFNRTLSANEIARLYDGTAAHLTPSTAGEELIAYNYVLYAIDENGDSDTDSSTLTMDVANTGPVVTLTSPTGEGGRYADADGAFTATATVRIGDAGTTLSSAEVLRAGVGTSETDSLSGTSDTISIATTGWSGTQTYNIEVTDSASNTSTGTQGTIVQGSVSYYVDDDGDAGSAGTIGDPFDDIQDFADICEPGMTCYVRAGTYRETVTPVRGGNAYHRITIQNYPSETATISGADLISDTWSVHSDSIYKTDGSDPTSTLGVGKDQVFLDGTALRWARWPNCSNVMEPTLAYMQAGSGRSSNTLTVVDANHTQADDYWNGAYIHGAWYPRYHAATGVITDFVAATDTITASCDINLEGEPESYGIYYLFNKLELLDSAGEFFYDSGGTTLYVWTPDSDDPGGHTMEWKARQTGIVLDGLAYVTVSGLAIFGCNVTMDYDSHHIILDDLDVDYVSHYWLLTESTQGTGGHGTKDTGIVLHGHDNLIQSSTITWSAGNGVTPLNYDNTVSYCTITNVNYAVSECGAVNSCIRKTEDITVDHCTLGTSSRGLVNFTEGRGWTITHNEIYGSRSGWETWDLGGVYSHTTVAQGTADNTTTIAYNSFHDMRGFGLYLDGPNDGVLIYGNLFGPHSVDGPMLLNTPSTNNQVYNNTAIGEIIVRCTVAENGTIFRNNLYDSITEDGGEGIETASNNLDYTGSETDIFADYSGGDYSLKTGSAAIDAGYTIPTYTEDITGKSVPVDGAYDIGAYEYGSGAVPALIY